MAWLHQLARYVRSGNRERWPDAGPAVENCFQLVRFGSQIEQGWNRGCQEVSWLNGPNLRWYAWIPQVILNFRHLYLRSATNLGGRSKTLMELHDKIADLKAYYDANKELKFHGSKIEQFMALTYRSLTYSIVWHSVAHLRPEQITELQKHFKDVESEQAPQCFNSSEALSCLASGAQVF